MQRLGMDERTDEEKFRDELRAEEETKDGLMNLTLNDGTNGGPSVHLMIDTKKNYAPKQDLSKPEKSIKLMQEKGVAG